MVDEENQEMPPHTPDNTIDVIERSPFGNRMIYPVCEKAHLFSALVKQKTLTDEDIELIKKLGYAVRQVVIAHGNTVGIGYL